MNTNLTQQAKNIINTYNTISDRLYVIYAKEFNNTEYYAPNINNDKIKSINIDNDNSFFIICIKEDDEENYTYILHKFELFDNNYKWVNTNTLYI
jgi:hypothetical protein